MTITIANDCVELGKLAGKAAAEQINKAIAKNGQANIILATGTSQFETLTNLIKQDIDWSKVTMFHLDEYIGLPEAAEASFRKYLKERFLTKVPTLKAVHLVNGEAADPKKECERLGKLIQENPIDVALVGIGENGHLGFNDPPADFDTEQPFIIVELDEPCRKQQLGEGWFPNLDAVPRRAITMSIKQILKSKQIICSVPDSRKAEAVKNSLGGVPVTGGGSGEGGVPVTNLHPASILQRHPATHCFLDKASAALL